MRPLLVTIAFFCSIALSGVHATTIDDKALADENDGANWAAYGRTYSEQRFSPLKQINETNIGKLGLAWVMDLPDDRSLNGTPLVVDGVMYFPGSYNVV